MRITSFGPLIMTNDAANVQKVFEELGFVKQHEKRMSLIQITQEASA